MNKEQDRPRRLAGFRRPHPLAIHPQGNVAFLGPVFAAPDLAALGTRRARAWRRQGAGESSGHEANPGPLDDRAPRQRMIEFFHGVLQSDEVFFADFYAALQPARHYVGILESLVSVVANPAVSRKSHCAAVRNNPNPTETGNRLKRFVSSIRWNFSGP